MILEMNNYDGSYYSYSYDELGNRLRQTVGSTVTNYLLDTTDGLTQVLADGTNTYLCGLNRISQSNSETSGTSLGDALGSVRQLASTSGSISISRNFEPYGTIYGSMGSKTTSYGFTSEWMDGNGLVNLRARYYAPISGKFITKDTWQGNLKQPISYNKWLYTNGNPINFSDPSGMFPDYCHSMPNRTHFEDCVRKAYGVNRPRQYDLAKYIYAKDVPGCHYEVSFNYPVDYDSQGYLEGLGTVWFGFLSDQSERVYDFSTMTSATFDISGGQISDALLGAEYYAYAGVIGFPYYARMGFSSQRTIDDYGGLTGYSSDGISTETPAPLIPAFGVFVSKFNGLNLNPIGGTILGVTFGFNFDPIPIADLTIGISNARIRQGSQRNYVYKGGNENLEYYFVNEGLLRRDILMGTNSPWAQNGIVNTAVNPVSSVRLYALSQLHRWVTIYNDLHNGK